MTEQAHNMNKEIQSYFVIGSALLVMMIVTVLLSYTHLGTTTRIMVALLIAIVQGSLAAYFLMHLNSEKRAIYLVLVLTVSFFAGMMSLIITGKVSVPEGTVNLEKQNAVIKHIGHHGVEESPETKGAEHP